MADLIHPRQFNRPRSDYARSTSLAPDVHVIPLDDVPELGPRIS